MTSEQNNTLTMCRKRVSDETGNGNQHAGKPGTSIRRANRKRTVHLTDYKYLTGEGNSLKKKVSLELSLAQHGHFPTLRPLADEDIFSNINNEGDTSEVCDDGSDDKDRSDTTDVKPTPSMQEAQEAVNTLRAFFKSQANVPESIFTSLDELDKFLARMKRKEKCDKQRTLKNFFVSLPVL